MKNFTEILYGMGSMKVDCFGSDQALHTLAEQAEPPLPSHSGMPVLQTLVPVMLLFTHVAAGRLSLSTLYCIDK